MTDFFLNGMLQHSIETFRQMLKKEFGFVSDNETVTVQNYGYITVSTQKNGLTFDKTFHAPHIEEYMLDRGITEYSL